MSLQLLLATNNQGKVAEFRSLLAMLPLEMVTPTQMGIADEPEETGATFEENALLKARYYAGRSGLLTLSDDSGLEVDALNGGPGIYSARYGGPGISDSDRVYKLLRALEGVPWQRRTARFRCVVALFWRDGTEETFHGVREGYIALEPRGNNGFGYDPIFFLPHLGKTMAELPPEVKNQLSHRA
ncbi:MAG: RdgB/HAM1 family non-canonical purine NTP pyrophosphatase, partial [Dehalococcoidia bacterium]|nr:RdgB/HAM1 family non-canonical purine NTP pyrophosphatase [Dehalococcoidia bacterium]